MKPNLRIGVDDRVDSVLVVASFATAEVDDEDTEEGLGEREAACDDSPERVEGGNNFCSNT